MSSRSAGKGTCACFYGQVSNIRLWPSPREEHRGDAGAGQLPPQGVGGEMAFKLSYSSSLSFQSRAEGEILVEWGIFRDEGFFGATRDVNRFGSIQSIRFEKTGQIVDEYEYPEIAKSAMAAVNAAYALHRLKLIQSDLRALFDNGDRSEFVQLSTKLKLSDGCDDFTGYVNDQLSHHLEMLRLVSERGKANLNI